MYKSCTIEYAHTDTDSHTHTCTHAYAETLDHDTIQDAKEELRVAQTHLQRLKMQSRSVVDGADRKEMKQKIKKHEKIFASKKRAIQKLTARVDRVAMSERSSTSVEASGSSARLLRLQEQGRLTAERLENARRLANETERSAQSSLDELYQQRETLLNSRKKALETQDVMGQARSILGRMGRRNVYNKILWYIMVVTAIVVLAIFLYVFLFR